MDHIVNETQKVYEHTIGHIKAGVNECLSKNGVEELPELSQFFASIEDPFEGLQSTYLQESFYRQKMGCMVCHSIFLCMCYGPFLHLYTACTVQM